MTKEIKIKKITKRKASLDKELPSKKGLLYIGHLPYGFEEDELKTFLSQYGDLNKIKLARSKKSKRSKGYAYILFEDEEVAKVVKESLEDYFMLGKKLKCDLLDFNKKKAVFDGNNAKFKFIPFALLHKNKVNKVKSDEEIKLSIENLIKKDEEKLKKFKKLGIDYKFPTYKSLLK